MVVDVGASNVSVTPIVDGYYLKNASVKQATGGNLLTAQCSQLLQKELDIPLRTHYQVKDRKIVGLKEAAQFTPKPFAKDVQESFKEFAMWRLVEDFKHCVCQISEAIYQASDLALRPAKYFEFPDGYNQGFLAERYRIPEILFNPKEMLYPSSCDFSAAQIANLLGTHELVQKSLNAVDIDLRATLCSNIILFGGSSLFTGLSDRLSLELSQLMPAQKFRIFAASTSTDRAFAPWIGGSVLASLSTFQQLWMTKMEFEEHGASFIEKRCQL